MKRDLELFFERLLTDCEFRDKFLTAKSAKEGYEIAKEYIPSVTFEEFREGVLIVDEKLKRNYKHAKKFNSADTSSVNGGNLISKWK